MTSNTQHPTGNALQILASDPRWRWSKTTEEDTALWHLEWAEGADCTCHRRFVDKLPEDLFPWEIKLLDARRLAIEADDAQPWSSLPLEDARPVTVTGLYESLGSYLRRLHDHESPHGFGMPRDSTFRHTFNAFMATEFDALNRHLATLGDSKHREKALETLASLRRELSAFHPHGRSCWTVGRLTAERLAVRQNPTRHIASMDFSGVALRPPEYDLAALRLHGFLGGERTVADRSFWKGYNAALTRDLDRRIAYFERLIELKQRLVQPPRL